MGSEIAGKLQREIPAEGITGNREGCESVHVDEPPLTAMGSPVSPE